MVPTDTAILYAAESAANWTGTATIPLTDTDAATLVNAMVDWLITNGWAITPNPTVAITSTASGVAASAWIDGPMIDNGTVVGHVPASITFSADALATRPWVVAHEVAHLVRPDATIGPRDSHGPVFATIYLTLVRAFYGDANADALADAFAEYGVATVE